MSFIQWPTLFGSTYFIPAMVIIVLLLALLLLSSSRRRKKAERARMAPDAALVLPPEDLAEDSFEGATAQTGQEFGHTPSIVTEPVAMSAQPAAMLSASEIPVETAPLSAPAAAMVAATPIQAFQDPPSDPFDIPPVDEFDPAPYVADMPEFEPAERRSKRSRKPSRPVRSAAVAVATAPVASFDPLSETITDILNGWGELTIEDMKRIELFRPGRVSTALAAVQLPKSKSDDMKLRLDQLRRYAIDMERREQAGPGAGAESTDADTETDPAAAASPAGSAFAPAVAGTAALVAPPAALRSFFDDSAPLPRIAMTPPESVPSFALDASESADSQAAAAQIEEDTPVVQEVIAQPTAASGLDTKASEWASPRALWEPDADEEEFEVLPAPAYDEVEIRTESAAVPTETPVAKAPVHIVMGAAPGEPPTVAPKPAQALGAIFWEDEMSEPLSRLGIRVETAEQLLSLPPSERMDMTAFLPPTELAATFRATQDLDLKKAVIDTLEHIGSPASLNALGTCFEDQDPGIQVYALAAADRLLGVL